MVFDKAGACRKPLAAATATIILASAWSLTPARAFEDTNTFNSVLGFVGLQFDKEDDSIDYRARPPIVVPPKMDLPQPVSKQARRGADWPVDPDVAAKTRAAADSRRPAPQITPNTRAELSPQELAAGRTDAPPAQKAQEGCPAGAGTPICIYTPWAVLNHVFSKDTEVAQAGEAAPRKYLTEPPNGYRDVTRATKVTADKVKQEPDAGDAAAYSRNSQRHKSSVDDD
jgi:hypothetical protein